MKSVFSSSGEICEWKNIEIIEILSLFENFTPSRFHSSFTFFKCTFTSFVFSVAIAENIVLKVFFSVSLNNGKGTLFNASSSKNKLFVSSLSEKVLVFKNCLIIVNDVILQLNPGNLGFFSSHNF